MKLWKLTKRRFGSRHCPSPPTTTQTTLPERLPTVLEAISQLETIPEKLEFVIGLLKAAESGVCISFPNLVKVGKGRFQAEKDLHKCKEFVIRYYDPEQGSLSPLKQQQFTAGALLHEAISGHRFCREGPLGRLEDPRYAEPIHRMLDEDPDRRYPSLGEARRSLEAALARYRGAED